MPRILNRYIYVKPLLLASLLLLLLILPGRHSLWNSFRSSAETAATFTVNSTGDGADSNLADGVCNDGTGACTLRAAIQQANNISADDTVTFSIPPGSSITLNTALDAVNGNLVINGPGANTLTVQRNAAGGTPNFRIFTIDPGTTVSITGLTISNGDLTATGNNGAGVLNSGTLTMTSCNVFGNSVLQPGGGIYNQGPSLTLNNCNIGGTAPGQANSSGSSGGGIYHRNGTLVMTGGSIVGNSGNGIFIEGTGTLNGVVISDNTTINSGGGIIASGAANILNCLIVNNTASSGGGGLRGFLGTTNVINSTVSGNSTTNGGGGGVVSFNGNVILTNVTVTNNRSSLSSFGGGIDVGGGLTLNNSIVAANFRGPSPSTIPDDINGLINGTSSYNLIGDGTRLTGVSNGSNGNQIGTSVAPINPQLGTLSNNGGPNLTHALLVGSPAIDAGNSSQTTDQRGQPRPIDDQTVVNAAGGNASDIGAYEAHTFEVNSTADSDDGLCRAPGTGNGCTLREAITAANGEVGAELIVFAPALTSGGPATINLSTVLPDMSSDMTIAGPGPDLLSVQRSSAGGTPSFRIFRVNSGANVIIRGITIANGLTADGTSPIFIGAPGGGILNVGTLTLTNDTIRGNHTGNGLVSGGAGAGIYNAGTLALSNSTISGNQTGTGGNGGSGGGILNNGPLTIVNTTISGNQTSNGGDPPSGGDGGFGGAIYNANAGTLTLINATVSSNSTGNGGSASTGGSGGGIYNLGTTNLKNTIVANNIIGTGGAGPDLSGTFNSLDYNLVENTTGSNFSGTATHDITGQDPNLGSLANNGGSTQTHALLVGSPAFDKGDNCVFDNTCSPALGLSLTTDQRGTGFSRKVDGPDADVTNTVDIGAFEAQISLTDFADQTINEDGSLSLPFNIGGAASITNLTATSSNTTLVPNNPVNISISGSGSNRTLLINPVANESGASTITVTVNGSNSQTMTDTFLLTVNPVNDAPSFTKGPDQTVNENDGAQTVNNWANNISAGPANEAAQALTFTVADNSNPSLFAVAPAISLSGTLTYTPAAGVSGIATITVSLMDNGGTANGGVDTSAQSFNIIVREGGALAFSSATYSVGEGDGSAAITITRSGGSAGTATVFFTTSNGTATAADYTSVSQTLTFNEGEVSKTVNVAITADLVKEPDETVNLTLSNAGGSGQLGVQTTALLTIVEPVGGYIRFSSADFNATESSGSTTITVERVVDTSQAVSVFYFTTPGSLSPSPCEFANGIASPRCDFTTALGTLRFAAGETAKTFVVLISQDNYVEGPETITLGLSNSTNGAALASPSAATLTIADDATEPSGNPIDSADGFVRQHYHDFLNREPDAAGLAFWTNQITECQQPGATCSAEVRRINVSAAFFLSIEFQETGYLAYRFYKSAYGNIPGTPVPIRLIEFLPDTQQIGKDVVIGQPGAEQQLEANKVAYALDFVLRSRFTSAYPTTLTPAAFVDALFVNAVVTPSATDRDAAINEFGGAGNTADTAARARALRRVAENSTLKQQETNKAFVLMQYFGYLRRNPNDPPETGLNFDGYNFWLGKLNEFNGNFVNAEMVKAFLISGEYRHRFGP